MSKPISPPSPYLGMAALGGHQRLFLCVKPRRLSSEVDTDVRVIQVLLGHAKLTTAARNTHVATKTLRNVASPFENIRDVT